MDLPLLPLDGVISVATTLGVGVADWRGEGGAVEGEEWELGVVTSETEHFTE